MEIWLWYGYNSHSLSWKGTLNTDRIKVWKVSTSQILKRNLMSPQHRDFTYSLWQIDITHFRLTWLPVKMTSLLPQLTLDLFISFSSEKLPSGAPTDIGNVRETLIYTHVYGKLPHRGLFTMNWRAYLEVLRLLGRELPSDCSLNCFLTLVCPITSTVQYFDTTPEQLIAGCISTLALHKNLIIQARILLALQSITKILAQSERCCLVWKPCKVIGKPIKAHVLLHMSEVSLNRGLW